MWIVLFIQCKTSGGLGVQEWNELYDLAKQAGAIPILAYREGLRGHKYMRLLAKKDGSKRSQPFEVFEIEPPSAAEEEK